MLYNNQSVGNFLYFNILYIASPNNYSLLEAYSCTMLFIITWGNNNPNEHCVKYIYMYSRQIYITLFYVAFKVNFVCNKLYQYLFSSFEHFYAKVYFSIPMLMFFVYVWICVFFWFPWGFSSKSAKIFHSYIWRRYQWR